MEVNLVNVLFTVVGFLLGGITIYPALLKKQNRMDLEINTNRKDIEKLTEGIAHIERHIEQYFSDSTELKKLLNKHLDQSGQMLQFLLANKNK